MLGQMLGEEIGTTTGIRVLPPVNGAPRMEASFTAQGTLLDRHTTSYVTYVATARPDGTLFGEGQGTIMTDKGETVTWVGQGVGQPTRPGAFAWRGAIYYSTESSALARLNTVASLFEFETDETGKTHGKTWEWK